MKQYTRPSLTLAINSHQTNYFTEKGLVGILVLFFCVSAIPLQSFTTLSHFSNHSLKGQFVVNEEFYQKSILPQIFLWNHIQNWAKSNDLQQEENANKFCFIGEGIKETNTNHQLTLPVGNLLEIEKNFVLA